MKKNKLWFTLIELIVAISIVIILSTITFLPYNHYQNKAKLRLASREISQSFYDAKSMALSWIKSSSWNISIGLYLEKNTGEISYFSYPHNVEEAFINREESWDTIKIKTNILQEGIKINNLWWKDNLLFFFDSITWKSKIYTFTSVWKENLTYDEIYIWFSYKNSTSPALSKEIIYHKNTNIIDYK